MNLKVQVTMLKNITKDKLNKLKNHTLKFTLTKISFMLMETLSPHLCQRRSKVVLLVKKNLSQMVQFSCKKQNLKRNKRKFKKVILIQAQTLILTPIEIYSKVLFK